MSKNAERWERRPVLAAVTGPSRAGLDGIRRHLARHPMIACPESASRFWETTYGATRFSDARPIHWGQAFFGLSGRIRCDVDPSLARLPSWKWGALAAHHPSIRVLYVVRDPVALSWETLRAHCEGPGDIAVRAAKALDGPELAVRLRSQADYAGHLATIRAHLTRKQVHVMAYEDLAARPGRELARIFQDVLRVGPAAVKVDESPWNPLIDSALPDEPPPAITERLAELHRDQAVDISLLV